MRGRRESSPVPSLLTWINFGSKCRPRRHYGLTSALRSGERVSSRTSSCAALGVRMSQSVPQPTTDDPRATRARTPPESAIPAARPPTIGEGVLADDSGTVDTVNAGTREETRGIQRRRSQDALSVIQETAAPVLRVVTGQESATNRPGTDPGSIRLTRTADVPSTRRQRRFEEHRERVAQMRERYGDTNQSLEHLLAVSFDQEALRQVAGEIAAQHLGNGETAPEDRSPDANER